MEIFWIFLYNLSYPVTIASSLGIAFCAIMSIFSFKVRTKFPFGSAGNTNARNRIWTYAHLAIVLSALFCLFYAIPSPTYDQKIVYKEKIVYREKMKATNAVPVPKIEQYDKTFYRCMQWATSNTYANNKISQLCHTQTMQAVNGTKILTITKYIKDPYVALFKECAEGWTAIPNITVDQRIRERNEIVNVCSSFAFKASQR